MDEKLKVVLQVSEAGKSALGFPASKPVFEFSGETELTLEELRTVLSYVVLGGVPTKDMTAVPAEDDELMGITLDAEKLHLSEVTALYDLEHAETVIEAAPKATRKPPKRKTLLVCQRCGRKFKGMSKLQKYCNKPDCCAVETERLLGNVIRDSSLPKPATQKRTVHYPTTRKTVTPMTPAVCGKCGRKYLAYTRLQKYCNQPDCTAVHAQNRLRGWKSQATIVAGQGVTAGAV